MERKSIARDERIRRASRSRREQEKEELRQVILKAAGELFLEQGYDRFSMRHLAETIGYSAATLYLYFRDKDDLLFTVVEDGYKRFARQLTHAAASSNDPWERLNALSDAYISFGLQNPVYYQLMFLWRTDFLTEVREGEDQPRIAAFSVLREAVQYAMDAGQMKPGDAEIISNVLWASMHGVISLSLSMPTTFDAPRTQQLTQAMRDLISQAYAQP